MMSIKGDGTSLGIKGELEIYTKEGALSVINAIQEQIDEGCFE
jgi:hypothetical protein